MESELSRLAAELKEVELKVIVHHMKWNLVGFIPVREAYIYIFLLGWIETAENCLSIMTN